MPPLAFSKPEPRKRTKARKQRSEIAVKRMVRAIVAARDGYCRAWRLGPCEGALEWAHLEDKRRAHTVGMPPEERHTTTHTCMLCTRHHQLYDARAFRVEFLTPNGADGRMRFVSRTEAA